jgi:DNA-binding CsgD family transcriptional regulator
MTPTTTGASPRASMGVRFVSTVSCSPGFMLLDGSLHPVAYNNEAIAILSFPTKPDQIKQMSVFFADKVRAGLLDRRNNGQSMFVREYKSGKRRYVCRVFRLDAGEKATSGISIALLLERPCSDGAALQQISEQFDLTGRELETVALLVEGLTSKEIANRMKISPNTVKAFLRLVMLKMAVTTRSGIVGKIVESR